MQARMRPYGKQEAVNEFLFLAQQKNLWEERRVNGLHLQRI